MPATQVGKPRLPGWTMVAFGVIALGGLVIVIERKHALRVKWASGSVELMPAA